MNETQEDLEIGIGDKEVEMLEPETVEIVKVEIQEVGEKKNEKVVCSVKHPKKEEPIKISSVKYETVKGKLETSGLWLNKDEDKKIRKKSALAIFLQHKGCKTLKDLTHKKVDTTNDERGYLCFKAY